MTYATLEQRQEAREMVAHFGKFEGESPMTPILYDMAQDGVADDYDCTEDGTCYDRIGRWIIWNDSQGFIYSRKFATIAEATDALYMAAMEDDSTE